MRLCTTRTTPHVSREHGDGLVVSSATVSCGSGFQQGLDFVEGGSVDDDWIGALGEVHRCLPGVLDAVVSGVRVE